MFIVTAKVPRRKLALSTALAALVCCCVLGLHVSDTAVHPVAAPTVPNPKGVKSNQDRVDYLAGYGWEVAQEPLSTQELVIPAEFDESYQDYLALQSDQGFDLKDYAKKRVKRYTYEVTNYPTGEKGVLANLLIYKNTVVGGEILSPQLDGFMHGLTMP